MSPEENFQYLSGLIIGAELKEIAPSMKNILLVSSAVLSESYLLALDTLGFGGHVQNINADQALIRGHLKFAG
jgi:2-dehydro-3-deoxygalactonokinase